MTLLMMKRKTYHTLKLHSTIRAPRNVGYYFLYVRVLSNGKKCDTHMMRCTIVSYLL